MRSQALRGMCVRVAFVVAGLVLVPAAARAQSLTSGSIAGVVRDTSGAVLPGVTAEAASPALIEKVRAVVTDASGQYKIVDLRPGLYTVTFTLPGFRTVRRDGIELTTGFTATINADLQVGALEETITVTGASPIVDTQNVRSQSVLSTEYLSALPTGKSAAALAALILGVQTGSGAQDVGGSTASGGGNLMVHGSRGGDYIQMVDGMRVTYQYLAGGGPVRMFFVNAAVAQEVVFETGGMSAESELAGVQQNLVPKDGGNTWSFTSNGIYGGPKLAADNLTDKLRARGLTTANSIKRLYDGSFGLGGPFKKDRVWFYTSHRWFGAAETVAGNYFNGSPNPLLYTPDLSRPSYSQSDMRDHTVRVAWQVAAKHKLTVSEMFQRTWRWAGGSATAAPEATTITIFYPVQLLQAAWTYPANNRLLFQVGGTYGYNYWALEPVAGVTKDAISVTELSTGLTYGSFASLDRGYGWVTPHQTNWRASASYVTGSHAFKTGFFMQAGVPAYAAYASVNQEVSYAFRTPTPGAAPVPVSVTQWASPRQERTSSVNTGFYAQDQWTVQRLTLNLGARFDRLHAWVPAQTRPGGRFVPEFSFGKVDNVPNWKDISPRMGAAYDLFGNGKTAIRAAFGRYVVGEASTLAGQSSPAVALVQSATRVWNDVNGDYVPQDSELGPLSNSRFGTVVQTTRFDKKVLEGWWVRPYSWSGSATLQQELRPGLGLTVGYFRTTYGNPLPAASTGVLPTDNLSVTPADYSPYCVTAPVDPRLPGGGNEICGLYDINPEKFGAVDNLVTDLSTYGKLTEVFNGVEVGLNFRFGRGGVLNGGVSTGRTVVNKCFVVDSPQQLYQCEAPVRDNPWGTDYPSTQVKINGAYPLPWDLQVSATYQNLQGIPILATLVYTNAQIAPSLGRNLGACRGAATCNATTPVSLLVPGTEFEDRYSQLDLRLTKTVRFGRARLQGMADAYNVLNTSTIVGRNNAYGPRWGRPTGVQLGRIVKFGGQLDW